MAATPITSSVRFFRPEVSKVYFVPDIANQDSPTRTELDAGTDLTPEISAIEGFGVTSGEIETPDMNSRFTSKIGGRTTVDESSITFYADKTGVDVRTVLPRGTTGYITVMGGGDVAGSKMDVFNIRVIAAPKQYTLEDEAAKLLTQFSVIKEPSEDVDIPA